MEKLTQDFGNDMKILLSRKSFINELKNSEELQEKYIKDDPNPLIPKELPNMVLGVDEFLNSKK